MSLASQLVPTSPVAKKHRVDQLIWTESITDWANRTGGFFSTPEYRGMGKQRSCDTLRPCNLLIWSLCHDIMPFQNAVSRSMPHLFKMPQCCVPYCQILVTKTSNGGRVHYILINFIPNIRPLNSKHFTYYLLNNGPPSAGQTM